MPCSSTSQLTNAPTVPLSLQQPKTPADWARFVANLQQLINGVRDAANRQPVNVVPVAYAVYNGTTLPSLSLTGATSSLDTTKHQFGKASLKLVATGSTITLSFSDYPISIQPFVRWIASVFVRSSRSTIGGTLAVVTANDTYSVDISGTLLATTWGRLYGVCDLTADDATTCTLQLTLTGCAVGDTFNLEGWQLEHAFGVISTPSPFVNTAAPADYVVTKDTADAAKTDAASAQTTADASASTADWSGVTDDNGKKPADNADVTGDNTANDVKTGTGKAVAEAGADKTSNNTAAAITGQGNLATKDTADFDADVSGTTKPANNATVGATTGASGNLLADDGVTKLTQADIKTSEGTANDTSYVNAVAAATVTTHASNGNTAHGVLTGMSDNGDVDLVNKRIKAFYGQGALATADAADWSTQVSGSAKPADNADVTGDNTAADTSNVDGVSASTIKSYATNGNSALGHVNDLSDAGYLDLANKRVLGFYGQGALATKDAVDLSTTQVTNKTLDNIADTDTYLRMPSASGSSGAVNIPNADFSIGSGSDVPGLAVGTATYSLASGGPNGTKNYLLVTNTSGLGTYDGPRGTERLACAAGDVLSISCTIWPGTVTSGGTVVAGYDFFDQSSSYLAGCVVFATLGSGWERYTKSTVAPANTAFAQRVYSVNGTAGQHAGFSTMRASINDVRAVGSGARLGDSRNAPAYGTAGFGGAWGSGSLSYSGSASSMTLSVDSIKLYNGSWQPTYNAASTTVSGTAGSTKDYYLYYDDAAQAGGSQTLHATTDQTVLAQADGRVTVGEMAVTFPSSGTGSGVGDPSCVQRDSWLRVQRDGKAQFVQAKDMVPVRRGDMIRAVDPATGREWWQQVTAAALATNDGVRVTCANDAQLDCSANAILGAADGSRVRADQSAGTSLYTRAGASNAAVVPIGTITVVRISAGGVFFLAGKTQDNMLAHHNLKGPNP